MKDQRCVVESLWGRVLKGSVFLTPQIAQLHGRSSWFIPNILAKIAKENSKNNFNETY